MKKKSKINGEIMRLKTVLESDRLNVAGGFDELITADLNALFGDYFDLKTRPVLTVTKENGGYLVKAEALAVRIKSFGVVPKD